MGFSSSWLQVAPSMENVISELGLKKSQGKTNGYNHLHSERWGIVSIEKKVTGK